MTTLPQTVAYLRQALLAEARTALAFLSAWLDPLALWQAEDAWPDIAEEDELLYALHVCRTCFPAVYAEATHALTQGTADAALSRLLVEGINRGLVVPVESLEALRWGVPFAPLGVSYGDDLREQYPALLPILSWLGGNAETGLDEVPHVVAGLVSSLEKIKNNPIAADLLCLLAWLQGSSGNTAVDYAPDAYGDSGLDFLDWTPPDVALVNEIHTEAEAFVGAALRGAHTLTTDAAWRQTFRRHCRLYRKRGNHDPHDDPGGWPSSAGNGAHPASNPAIELL